MVPSLPTLGVRCGTWMVYWFFCIIKLHFADCSLWKCDFIGLWQRKNGFSCCFPLHPLPICATSLSCPSGLQCVWACILSVPWWRAHKYAAHVVTALALYFLCVGSDTQLHLWGTQVLASGRDSLQPVLAWIRFNSRSHSFLSHLIWKLDYIWFRWLDFSLLALFISSVRVKWAVYILPLLISFICMTAKGTFQESVEWQILLRFLFPMPDMQHKEIMT